VESRTVEALTGVRRTRSEVEPVTTRLDELLGVPTANPAAAGPGGRLLPVGVEAYAQFGRVPRCSNRG
jgi:hypothetical protein